MIVMTGASGGLGSYLVRSLSCDYPIIAIDHGNLPESVTGDAEYYKVDITDSESIKAFMSKVEGKLEHIQLLNMAGVSLDGTAHRLSEQSWRSSIDTNLTGSFLMARALLPLMRQQSYGRIINFSSVVGKLGVPGAVAYAASKTGLDGLTRVLAIENAGKNILVNNLSLGYFNAGMMHTLPADMQSSIRSKIPLGKLGDPKDVALAVRFLLECDYITGTTLHLNGGLYGL
ncbi:MAG: SDR family oxidoreductase [Deltaproteobacteria bacterium]|nr:SDR family oxidoreductase [Deltaproteobacteria bacterium]